MRTFRTVIAMVLLVVPAAARAQTMTTTMTTTQTSLTATDFLISLWADTTGDGKINQLSAYQAERFFNTARCECDTPVRIRVGFTPAGAAKRNTITTGQYKVIIGPAACVSADAAARSTSTCEVLTSGKLVGITQPGYIDIDTTTGTFFKNISTGCRGTKRLENIRIWIDVNQDDIPDLADQSAPTFPVQLDSDPPAQPSGVTVRGGNEALDVDWKSLGGLDDFQGYLLLCSRGEDLVVFKDSGFNNQFMTRGTQCGAAANKAGVATLTPDASRALPDFGSVAQTTSGGADDTGRGPLSGPRPFAELDPDYLCSGLITTGTGSRIQGLQNGIPYLVGVGAVDRSGNISQIRDVYLQSPLATRDFYTGYREAGGAAEGGFCSVSGRKGSITLPWFAAFIVFGGLCLCRRVARAGRRR